MGTPWRSRLPLARVPLLLLLVAGPSGRSPADSVVLADPALMLTTGERVDFVGSGTLAVESSEHGTCLRSTPARSATGIYQRVEMRAERLSKVEWSWRVDRLHAHADIRDGAREDFGAKIAFVFGEPTFWSRDVPTLAYVWTSTPVPNGTILRSSRYANLRYVQLHGPREVGSWQRERRNVDADYKAAFGTDPDRLRYVAVFNDNDQTGEATSALFARVDIAD